MKQKPSSRRRRSNTKSILRLPDLRTRQGRSLEQSHQRGNRHAIDEFVDWFCSEPHLAFN
jgi:hypothetical protein